jgi:hypothetical protein
MKAYYGRITGMTLTQYCAFLFARNENRTTKLLDESLLIKVKDEFRHYPELNITLDRLRDIRHKYNAGDVTKVFPSTPSFRYSKSGEILNRWNKPISQKSIRLYLEKFHQRRKRKSKHAKER